MIPRFLNTSFKFVEITNVTDVQQIIDAFRTMALAPADTSTAWTPWTDLGGDWYRSPANTIHVPQFEMQLTRSTQYRLQMVTRTLTGFVMGTGAAVRGIQIPSTNSSVARIGCGDGHFACDVITWSANPEYLMAGTVDVTPDQLDFIGINLVWHQGTRRCSDWVRDNVDGHDQGVNQWGDDAALSSARSIFGCWRLNGGSPGPKRMLSGAPIYRPRNIWVRVRGDTGTYGVEHWCGRAFQSILVPDGVMGLGSKFYAPIDTGTLAQFYVMGGPTTSSSGVRVAFRIG